MFIVIKDGIDYIRIDTAEDALPYSYKGIDLIPDERGCLLHLKKGYRLNYEGNDRLLEKKKYLILCLWVIP